MALKTLRVPVFPDSNLNPENKKWSKLIVSLLIQIINNQNAIISQVNYLNGKVK